MTSKLNNLQSNQQSTPSTSSTSFTSLPVSLTSTKTFRSAYSQPVRVSIIFPAIGRTKQSFKDECDINNIMARYQATGVLEHTKEAMPRFLDVSSLDFQNAMETIAHGNAVFAELPATLRERFGNDPAELLEWVHDPDNASEAVELGFLDPNVLPKLEAARAAVERSEGTPNKLSPKPDIKAPEEPKPAKPA